MRATDIPVLGLGIFELLPSDIQQVVPGFGDGGKAFFRIVINDNLISRRQYTDREIRVGRYQDMSSTRPHFFDQRLACDMCVK